MGSTDCGQFRRECSSAYSRIVSSIAEARLARRAVAAWRSRLLSTSDAEPVQHVDAQRRRPRRTTASAASSVQPPTKTASRANSALLGLVEQVVAPGDRRPQRLLARRQVARRRPVSSGSRRSSRASSACGDSSLHPRRGQLDRQRQPVQPARRSRPPPARSRSVSAKSGCTARARSTNSATAAYCDSSSPAATARGSGSASGGTGNSCSPRSCSGARLVTSTFSPGTAASSSATSGAAPQHLLEVVEHQQQSPLAQVAARASRASGSPGCSRTPSAWAIAGEHQAGIGDRRQLDEEHAVREACRRVGRRPGAPGASCPCPPGPVSVTSRTSRSSRPPSVGQLALAADHAASAAPAGCSGGVERAQRREADGQLRRNELEDALRLRADPSGGARPGRAGPASDKRRGSPA